MKEFIIRVLDLIGCDADEHKEMLNDVVKRMWEIGMSIDMAAYLTVRYLTQPSPEKDQELHYKYLGY